MTDIPQSAHILSMTGIGKMFAGVPALKKVDFEVRGGETHALLGANGAGKSTLMKILSGAYESDEGTVAINGQPLVIRNPSDAKRAGIHCVYQEVDTSLVPNLSAAENIMLDRISSPVGKRWISWRRLYKDAANVLAKLGLAIDVRRQVSDLTLAEKQLVLIARLFAQEAKFVILDEPTAPLSFEEGERLFELMDGLKRSGIGIVFISHRLPEVFRASDFVTVLRDGRNVMTGRTDSTDAGEVVRAMLGKSFEEEYPKLPAVIGETLLEVRGLVSGKRVRGVDLSVRTGEIVAVVGVVGCGKTELSRALFGADVAEGGAIRLEGRDIRLRCTTDAAAAGIGLVPEERRKEGILVKESVLHNLTLPSLGRLSRFGIVSGKKERSHANGVIDKLGIKASRLDQEAAYLSGGNQQKVAIGKWTSTDARLFIFDEPTKGVDVGAKRDIFRIIGKLAQQGKGVLYLTAEFAEAIGIADRILVMCDGKIVHTFARGEATQEHLLYYASAGKGERLA